MDFQNVLSVASKDFETIKRRRSLMYVIIGLPLLMAFLFSLTVQNTIVSPNAVPSTAGLGLQALTFAFVILAAVLPTSIAAYSIVGEKVEKSLEPLLATPLTDGEILLGKSVASFVPPILATWAGASIFMAITDYLTHDLFGYYYFPDWDSVVMLFLLAPLAAMLGVEVAVIVSSRVSDVRGANQIGGLMWLPFMIIFVAGVSGSISFGVVSLLIISGILLAINAGVFFVSTSVFRREEILTKWK